MEAASPFWRDPALPHAESRRACDSRACYRPHSHPTYSIGAVDRGTSVFTGAAAGPVVLHPGTLVFVPPARAHACNPTPGRAWSYQMLHLDARWWHATRGEEAHAAAEATIRICRDPAEYARFCALNDLLFSATPSDEKQAALRAFAAGFDATGGAWGELPARRAGHLVPRLWPAMEALREERGSMPLSLDELAALVGMNRYQLIRAFRAATGMTPHAWRLDQRVNRARASLRAGEDLASVAHRLGFADQSHFQRVFKAHAGITPGRYRA
ncbi:AraC family transcriptional regulator [Pseudothauera nasutitermitis]|uniref:AraC family transcriptional regulator n=1 Tax=Pseudothauera nasutitermitis TaxID=2565930 RepID=A0A4S4B005_9RHOO|nr:AraC family transcriptional regulator [Pseudothauera nasutitermitis]THF65790.1 AraC family transcriptional regulator [Pseudothauera nasutitermitis]